MFIRSTHKLCDNKCISSNNIKIQHTQGHNAVYSSSPVPLQTTDIDFLKYQPHTDSKLKSWHNIIVQHLILTNCYAAPKHHDCGRDKKKFTLKPIIHIFNRKIILTLKIGR